MMTNSQFKGMLKSLEQGERKNKITILLGNVLDHYDTHIYVLLAPFIAEVFFAQGDNLTKQILTFAIASVGIITRPLGAIIFGRLALLLGPLKALKYSLIGIALATFSIAILPTYDQIGPMSPFLLLLLRALQSIFASGEGAISGLYIVSSSQRKRHTSSSVYSMSTMLGMLIAAGIASLISSSSAPQLYWRIGFAFGFLTSIISIFIRSTSYRKSQINAPANNNSIWDIVKKHKSKILRLAVLNGFSYISYPIAFTIINSILPVTKGILVKEALYLHSYLIMLDFGIVATAGLLLKYIKPERFMLVCIFLILIASSILLYILPTASLIEITLLRILVIFVGVPFGMALRIWTANITDTCGEEKYLISAIGGGFGMELFGRSTTVLALFLFTRFSSLTPLIIYITILGIASIYAIISFSTCSK